MKVKPGAAPGKVVVELGPDEKEIPGLKTEKSVEPIFALRRILVPLDFSDCSRKALQYAIPLARQFKAEITLIHVAQSYPMAAELGDLEQQDVREAEKELKSIQSTVRVPVKTVVRTGAPHKEIVHAATELGMDMIVLATHGRTGLAHALLGSTAEKIVRLAGCPVLIVREREKEFIVEDSESYADEL